MKNLSQAPDVSQAPRVSPQIASDEFELEMVDFGSAYQAADNVVACLSCYCGSGCLCGCINL